MKRTLRSRSFTYRRALLSQQLNSAALQSPSSLPPASTSSLLPYQTTIANVPGTEDGICQPCVPFRSGNTQIRAEKHHDNATVSAPPDRTLSRNQSLSLCSPFHPPGSGISQPGHRTVMCLPCISVAARVLQLQPGPSGPIGDGDRRDICHRPPPPGGAAWDPHRGECRRSRQPSEC